MGFLMLYRGFPISTNIFTGYIPFFEVKLSLTKLKVSSAFSFIILNTKKSGIPFSSTNLITNQKLPKVEVIHTYRYHKSIGVA